MAVNNCNNLNSTNLVVYDGSSAFLGRTITQTANNISVSNGDGAAGNPTLSLPSDIYVSGISFDSGTNILSSLVNVTSFSPTVAGSTSAGVGTYTTQSGYYIRVGGIVFISISLVWTNHTGTGQIRFGDYPVSSVGASSLSLLIDPLTENSSRYSIVRAGHDTSNDSINLIASGIGITATTIQTTGTIMYSGWYTD